MIWWVVGGFLAGGGLAEHLAPALAQWGGGAGAVAGWLAHSLVYPRVACTWCSGNPKRRDGSGRVWRNCFVCGGSGQRRRVGARVLRRHRRA